MARVLVIGGGPAGMMAAATAASRGHEVSLLEQNRRKGKVQLGKKLLLTGNGRCNVTNNADLHTFIANVNANGKFLYSALANFGPDDTRQLLADYGLATKEEDRGRVFPISDRAGDVIQVLRRQMEDYGVEVISGQALAIGRKKNQSKNSPGKNGSKALAESKASKLNRDIEEENMFEVKYLALDPGQAPDRELAGQKSMNKSKPRGKNPRDERQLERRIEADRVIIATGGLSYPMTGSTGDGYDWARNLGHSITDLRASQVPLEVMDEKLSELQGVSVSDVEVSLIDRERGKTLFCERGDIIFTHYGISGPVILAASAQVKKDQADAYKLRINFLPELTVEELDEVILAALAESKKGQIGRLLQNTITKLPKKLIFYLLSDISICYDVYVYQLTKNSRYAIINHMANFDIGLKGLRPINEAVVTSGGIKISEIDAKTMESKLVKGLYFAGEIIDIDANTGGYNIQIALSTGNAAGNSC